MVDMLGLPTIFFTHSAADLQWPELARLICPVNSNSSASRIKAVNENPAIADWFFCYRVQKFVEMFYLGVLKATDYWLRFDWQHRGSPHVHGVAWLPNAPDVEQLLKTTDNIESVKEDIIQYANKVVTTINPAVTHDGSNVDDAPPPVTQPHICNKSYLEVEDHIPANRDIHNAQKPTAFELGMESKYVDLAIQNHCSPRLPLSLKENQLY